MSKINVAIAGVGNCASSLIQGLFFYKDWKSDDVPGLMHKTVGGYEVSDIAIVAAFDVDAKKVGKDVSEAIWAGPNCTMKFSDVPKLGVKVLAGPILDGVPAHLATKVKITDEKPVDVVKVLRESKAEVLVNILPTGSAEASRFYANAAIEAGAGFVNGIPELIVCDEKFARKAEEKGVPLVGDDFKSQVGGSILHRDLINLFLQRGIKLKRSYQLNYAGNTDFLNLINRGESKHKTKLGAVTSILPYDAWIDVNFSYIEVQEDNKVCRILMEGENFGKTPIRINAELEVVDSANSAGVLVDALRCCKLALDRGIGGVLASASAYLMKHPPKQFKDAEARQMLDEFIAGKRQR